MPSVKRDSTAATGSAPPPTPSPSSSTSIRRSNTTYGIGSGGGGGQDGSAPAAPRVMVRSASSAKEIVLTWVQDRVNTYPEMNVTNFSTCWNDGLAFCALIHYFYPEAFDFSSLDPANRRYNFTLAFDTAEKYADICPLLEVDDMVRMKKPDWKCVFTYVQSFYRRFRNYNGREPPPPQQQPQRSKTIAVGAHEARQITSKLSLHPNIQSEEESPKEETFTETVFGSCPDQALSADHQKRLWSKYLMDDDDDNNCNGLRPIKKDKVRPVGKMVPDRSMLLLKKTASLQLQSK